MRCSVLHFLYICRNYEGQCDFQIKTNRMKKVFMIIAAMLCFFSAKAETVLSEPLPMVENNYLEEMLAANFFAQSQFTNRDFLIASFISENQKRFFPADLLQIKNSLQSMPDNQLLALNGVNFKDPTVSVVLSVLVGGLGVDRFYIGDTGLGVLKLITGGGLGIWWLVDLFIISDKTKENNKEDLDEALMLNSALMD